jgi:hypothetical protein
LNTKEKSVTVSALLNAGEVGALILDLNRSDLRMATKIKMEFVHTKDLWSVVLEVPDFAKFLLVSSLYKDGLLSEWKDKFPQSQLMEPVVS